MMKDKQWFTVSTPLAWSVQVQYIIHHALCTYSYCYYALYSYCYYTHHFVQGVHPPIADGTEILTVGRSASAETVAVGDQVSGL
jgi:hypothetical protein